jgi:hypothetical protein
MRAEVNSPEPSVFPKGWDVIYVDEVKLPKNKSLQGRTLEEIARSQGKAFSGGFCIRSARSWLVEIGTRGRHRRVRSQNRQHTGA